MLERRFHIIAPLTLRRFVVVMVLSNSQTRDLNCLLPPSRAKASWWFEIKKQLRLEEEAQFLRETWVGGTVAPSGAAKSAYIHMNCRRKLN